MLRGRALPTGRYTATILLVAACAADIQPAMAKVGIDLTGGATVGVEHDTNPFQVANAEPLPAGIDDAKRGDVLTRLSANANAAFIAGPIELQLLTTFSHVEYKRFDTLNRNDFNLNGNLLWNSRQDGVYDFSLQYTQSHLPVGPADTGGNSVTQQNVRSAQGKLRVRPTSRWEFGLTPTWTESKTPLDDQPDFGYRVISGRLSLDYLGAGRVIPGVAVVEAKGRYTSGDARSNLRFRDETFEGTLVYRTKSRSSVTLAAGYTERTTSLPGDTIDPAVLAIAGKTPAFTGSLNFNYQLSVKTNLYVTGYRSFQQYQGGVNTLLGTGFVAGATWSPTPKISVTVDSGFSWSSIEGAPLGDVVTQRKDLLRTSSFNVNYQATRRVLVHTYVRRQLRNSTIGSAQFNSTVAGMDLSARLD